MNDESTPRSDEDIENIAPQKLLVNFTENRTLKCLGLAAAIHVLVLCGSSPRYIYEAINPEAKKVRLAREDSDKLKDMNEKIDRESPAAKLAREKREAEKSKADAASTDGEADTMEKRMQTDAYKETVEKAAADEIPSEPEDIGISLEDTEL
ncbi:MAG: hypothetical protein O2923_02495 [Verrucomicrobia bacterium]|nr:hypothetical protein [Verrucomicrobiota bacterium]MDA1086150.1 hypothetical protein [Verrucomicrobiota bacterium]